MIRPLVVNMVMFIGLSMAMANYGGEIRCYNPFWKSILEVALTHSHGHHYLGIRFTIHFDPFAH